jgi:hypothetical protein
MTGLQQSQSGVRADVASAATDEDFHKGYRRFVSLDLILWFAVLILMTKIKYSPKIPRTASELRKDSVRPLPYGGPPRDSHKQAQAHIPKGLIPRPPGISAATLCAVCCSQPSFLAGASE